MKNLFTSIVFSLSVPFVAFALDNNDPIYKSVSQAREFSYAAINSFNDANRNIETIDTNYKTLKNDFFTNKSVYENISIGNKYNFSEYSELKEKLSLLQKEYKENAEYLNSLVKTMDKSQKYFPLGEDRIKYGEKLCEKILDIATANPGENYQNLNYAKSIISAFNRKCSVFKDEQNFAVKTLRNLELSNPRIESIQSSLGMASDFLNKFDQDYTKHSKNIEAIKPQLEKIINNINICYEKLNKYSSPMRECLNDYTLQSFELDNFIMNKMPKKYKEFTFIPIFINRQSQRLMKASSKLSECGFNSAANDAKAEEHSFAQPALKEKQRAGSLMANKGDSYLQRSINIDKIVAQVSAIGKELDNLSDEISNATTLIRELTVEANQTYYEIVEKETSAKDILTNSISLYAKAQSTASEIVIFNNSLNVLLKQTEIALENIKDLSSKVDSDIANCRKSLEGMDKSMKAAFEEFEK